VKLKGDEQSSPFYCASLIHEITTRLIFPLKTLSPVFICVYLRASVEKILLFK